MTTYQFETSQNPYWNTIKKPAEIVETRLIDAILNGFFPINSHLPAERKLAESLGVTRPTLREALQRLERDGWVEIHQGKSTRVRDYWKEGKLGVLNALSEHTTHLPDGFIPNLLNVRLAMAPMYTALAVSKNAEKVLLVLDGRKELTDSPERVSLFDWSLQHQMTLLSENPVFALILNGFEDLYLKLAPFYFANPGARQHSLAYYEALAQAACNQDPQMTKEITEKIMQESLAFWQQTKFA